MTSATTSVLSASKMLFAALVCSSIFLLLNGCAMGITAPSAAVGTPLGAITGKVHGGRQPIVAASMYVYAADTSAYGGASTSLLTSATGHTDANGNNYVLTDANGSFSLGGEYTCVAGTQIYLLSLGGQPTTGTTNSAAGLIAVLGQCPASGSMASVTPTVALSEVSTVAAGFALSGFAVDATHIGAPSASSPLAAQGLANAFANASLLYDISGAHGSGARTTTASGGVVPSDNIQALANSLAACVNSTGPSSTQCTTNLFAVVKSAGTTGTQATDTATESIFLAHNPATAVETVFDNIAPGGGAPFFTALTSAPNDFTLGISYSGGGLRGASGIAIDGGGNAWVSNAGNNSLTEFTAAGVASNVTGGGLNAPSAIAMDLDGNAWVANRGNGTVTEFVEGVGTAYSYWAGGHTATSTPVPTAIAVDGSGNVWVGSADGTAYKLNSNGTFSAESWGANTLLSGPSGIAIDNYVSATTGNDVFFSNSVAATSVGATKMLTVPQASNNSWTNGGVGMAYGIAADSTNHVWVANANDTLGAVSSLGQAVAGAPCSGGGLSGARAIAIDGNNTVFLANQTGNSVSEFTKACVAISPATHAFGYVATLSPAVMSPLHGPSAMAIDGSGSVWVANGGVNTVVEFVGMAAPSVTPLALGASAGHTPGLKP